MPLLNLIKHSSCCLTVEDNCFGIFDNYKTEILLSGAGLWWFFYLNVLKELIYAITNINQH